MLTGAVIKRIIMGSKEYKIQKYNSIIIAWSGKVQIGTGMPRAKLNYKLGKRIGQGVISRIMILNNNKIDYVHWDDSNELVDRLRLLKASRQAGHNAHDNEILSIIEEPREAGFIIN